MFTVAGKPRWELLRGLIGLLSQRHLQKALPTSANKRGLNFARRRALGLEAAVFAGAGLLGEGRGGFHRPRGRCCCGHARDPIVDFIDPLQLHCYQNPQTFGIYIRVCRIHLMSSSFWAVVLLLQGLAFRVQTRALATKGSLLRCQISLAAAVSGNGEASSRLPKRSLKQAIILHTFRGAGRVPQMAVFK